MANDNEIPLEINADTKAAQESIEKLAQAIEKAVGSINKSLDGGLNDSVKKVEKNTEKSASSISSFFNSVKGAAIAAIGVIAAKELIGFFGDIINEAAEADKNVQALNIALASTGEFSEESSKGLQEFASGIQATTTLTDDAVLQALTLAKSFGITNDQAQSLTKAAVDLSAATGKDLDSSIQILGASLSGTSGKLSKLGPEFKNLTEEQLKAGAAIDLVAKRFDGFAEGLTQTFSGALGQARNNFGEILESLGKAVTQNPVVIASINAVSKAFAQFAEFIGENQEGISKFISTSIKFSLQFVGPILDGIKLLLQGFQALTKVIFIVLDAFLKLSDFIRQVFEPLIRAAVDGIATYAKILFTAFSSILEGVVSLGRSVPGVSSAFEKFGVNLGEVESTLTSFRQLGVESLSESNDELADSILNARDGFSDFLKDGIKAADAGISSAISGYDSMSNAIKGGVNSVLAVDDASKKAGTSIKNQAKATRELAEANEAVKGSFDKLKGELENITKEINKQTKSAKELIDIEADRGEQLAKNAEIELKQQGKLKGEVVDIIAQYRSAQKAKRDLAIEALSISDFTVGELGQSLANQLNSFKDGISGVKDTLQGLFSGEISFGDIGSGLQEAGASAGSSFVDTLKNAKLGDIFSGIGTVLVQGFEFGKNLLNGAFVNQFTDIIAAFGNLPQSLLSAFENLDQIVTNLVDSLPKVFDKLIDTLPALGEKIGAALGPLFQKLAEKLPDLIKALFKALTPILKAIFEEVIPTLIRALPELFRSILAELPGIIRIILGALPEIIKELAKAIPQIVRAIADALPDIILAIVESLPDIAEALVEGLIGGAGEIIAALVESLLVEGGLERIVVAIIKAIPRIAVALVQGFGKGMLTAGQALGGAFLHAVQGGAANIGRTIAGGFTSAIQGLGQFFSNIGNVFGNTLKTNIFSGFTQGVAQIPRKIIEGFQGGISQLGGAFGGFFSGIISTFQGAGNQIFNVIQGAFNGIFEPLRGSIFGPFINAFDQMGQRIRDAFNDPVNALRNAITEPFKPIIDFLRNFKIEVPGLGGGGGGGVGGFVASVGKKLGFAEGALVPPGFPNDTFPANLTSGELVIPPDISSGLMDIIKNGQPKVASGPDLNTALLNKIVSLLSQPVNVSTTANVNGKALADIILQLNRNNARLSA